MKTFAKFGLIGLALAASSAHADVFLPNTGNGELTLFVRNEVTGAVYARGLQIRLDSILTQAQINEPYTGDSILGIVQDINYALGTIGPDANLTSFLAAAGAKTWTISGPCSVITGAPSFVIMAPSTIQSAWVTPLPNRQRPLNRTPPWSRTAAPAGSAINARGASAFANTSFAPASGM